ncbi:MAG: hypothetical protein U5L74_04645 [Ideonella sp.]|nr:hypothetical protein [Ideonella sp.]
MLKYPQLCFFAALACAVNAQANQTQPLGSSVADPATGSITYNFVNSALSKASSNGVNTGQFVAAGPLTSLSISASGHQRLSVAASVSANAGGLGVYSQHDNKTSANKATMGLNYTGAETAEALIFAFGKEVTLNNVGIGNFGPSAKGIVLALNAAGGIVDSANLSAKGLGKPLKGKTFRVTAYASPSNNFVVSSLAPRRLVWNQTSHL